MGTIALGGLRCGAWLWVQGACGGFRRPADPWAMEGGTEIAVKATWAAWFVVFCKGRRIPT